MPDTVLTIRPTITVSASPDYSSGDTISGIITLTGAGRSSELRSITLRDSAGQAPALTLLFFKATPAGGTYTDNAALSLHADDVANLIGVVTIAAADWYTASSRSFVAIGDIGQVHSATSGSDIFLLIVAGGAYNAAATTDLTAELNYVQRG